MSNAARKSRKKAGIPFTKSQKVATPLVARAWFSATFVGVPGTRSAGMLVPRSVKKIKRALADRGIVAPATVKTDPKA